MTENQQARQKLQDELRKLFQFDVSDLDFGIYRILNRKKDQIQDFIEKDLLDAVNEALKEYQQQDASQVDEIMQQIIENLSDDAFDDQGNLVKYENTKLGKDYLEALEKAEKQEVGADTEKKIYNDLFTFFSRYYDNGDFLSKRRISTRDSKYAVPYNGEEVLLHWANKDQYYIKTGEQFTSFKFDLDGSDKSVWFKVAQAETEKDNVKEEESRSFVLRPENPIEVDGNELTLWFEYRPLKDAEEEQWLNLYKKVEKPRKTVDRSVLCVAYNEFVLNEVSKEWRDLLSVIPKNKDRSVLYHKLNHYTGKNTTDYFIHKDLKSFLDRELEYYLKNEVIRVDDFIADQSQQAMEVALTRAKVVRHIGQKIIAFLSQIENFQKKLFEKRKFVVDTHYCFTLDKVPEVLYDAILKNEEQLQNWVELYAMDKWKGELHWDGKWTKEFLKEHPFMMVDTRFFDGDFRFELLSAFDDLDKLIEGNAVNGDNYHALNLLSSKYDSKIKTVYIDPPYNTEKDREEGKFIYKDSFVHSSWLAMMQDRLSIMLKYFREDGVFFSSIDNNENYHLRSLLNSIFTEQNFEGMITWRRRHNQPNDKTKMIGLVSEYIISFAKDSAYYKNSGVGKVGLTGNFSNPDNDPRGPWASKPWTTGSGQSGTTYKITTPTGKDYEEEWMGEWDTFKGHLDDNRIYFPDNGNGKPRKKYFKSEREKEGQCATNWWEHEHFGHNQEASNELYHLFGKKNVFSNPKPSRLIEGIINVSNCVSDNDILLDFFAGSGTSANAILNLNRNDLTQRKYILIDMGQYFDTVIIPRIKKIAFSQNWEVGIPEDKDGQSHAFKYHFIESYEDALNNIDFKNPEDTQQAMEFEDYMLHYMLDFETQGVSATLLKEEAFETPFGYQLNIQRGHDSPKPESVDMVETFHYLIGLWVQTLRRHEHQKRKYVVSKGQIRNEDATEEVCVIWRNTKDLDLDKEAKWVQETIINKHTFDRIYVNGVSKVKNSEPIELTFREKMFEDVA